VQMLLIFMSFISNHMKGKYMYDYLAYGCPNVNREIQKCISTVRTVQSIYGIVYEIK